MSRPLSTTEANGPHSAAGTGLALDSFHHPLGHHTHRFPTADAFLPDASKTGPVASIYSATGPFPFDHIAHATNSQNILETRNSDDVTGDVGDVPTRRRQV